MSTTTTEYIGEAEIIDAIEGRPWWADLAFIAVGAIAAILGGLVS